MLATYICIFFRSNTKHKPPKLATSESYQQSKYDECSCSLAKKHICHDICFENKTAMTKDKKFQHKWVFDENLAYFKETRIWCSDTLMGNECLAVYVI